MKLSPEQQLKIKEWIDGGASLSDVQKQLDSELGIRMTYMEVRFLIDDLNIELQKPVVPEQKEEEEEEAELMPASVQVSLDRVTRPGSVISGTVTFSDGVNADWSLDQMGRLGFGCKIEGYNPPQEDMQDFQLQLRDLLSRKGMADGL